MTRNTKVEGTYLQWACFLVWSEPTLTACHLHRSHVLSWCLRGIANIFVQTQKNGVTWSGRHQGSLFAPDKEWSTKIFELVLRLLVWAQSVSSCYTEVTGAWKRSSYVSPRWRSCSASSCRTSSDICIISEFSAESFIMYYKPKVRQ